MTGHSALGCSRMRLMRSAMPRRSPIGRGFSGFVAMMPLSSFLCCSSVPAHGGRGLDEPDSAPAIAARGALAHIPCHDRSEEHTSELQSLIRISYAVFFLKKKTRQKTETI